MRFKGLTQRSHCQSDNNVAVQDTECRRRPGTSPFGRFPSAPSPPPAASLWNAQSSSSSPSSASGTTNVGRQLLRRGLRPSPETGCSGRLLGNVGASPDDVMQPACSYLPAGSFSDDIVSIAAETRTNWLFDGQRLTSRSRLN